MIKSSESGTGKIDTNPQAEDQASPLLSSQTPVDSKVCMPVFSTKLCQNSYKIWIEFSLH